MQDKQQEYREISASVKDGSYFTHMRSWYNNVYLQPMADRLSAIGLSIVAITIFGFSYFAVQNLLPLNDKVPFVYLNQKGFDFAPSLTRLRSPGENINVVAERVLLDEYVKRREGYREQDFVANQKFILRYSMSSAVNSYKQLISRNNPRNPLVRYQNKYKRYIDITSRNIQKKGDKRVAVIEFTSSLVGGGAPQNRQWRAQITYQITPWNISGENIVDQETGDIKIEMADTGFKVMQYDVFDVTR